MPIAYDPSGTAPFQPERADTLFGHGPPPGDEALAAARYAFRIETVLARELAGHAPVNCLRAFWP
jgi:hypothetical protein